jgi:flavodoxin I
MKIIVVYDSVFGNTEQIARVIGNALGSPDEVGVLRVTEVKTQQIKDISLIVVGSPTRGFRPTKPIQTFLKNLPAAALDGVRAAAFDTRIAVEDTNSGFLKLMVKIFGYAAGPMARGLKEKGGMLAAPAEGFFVKESEGPLKAGEVERAAAWARLLIVGQ